MEEYSELEEIELSECLYDLKRDFLLELSEHVDYFEDEEYDVLLENLECSVSVKEWNECFNELLDWANYSDVYIKLEF